MNAAEHQRGFTLLELLLAMVLTALLLGMLSAGVQAVVGDWTRDTSGLDETLDQSLVVLQLERALLAAFPHSYADLESVSRVLYFHGEPETLAFVSTVSPQRRPGLTAWQLHNDPQQGLMLRLTPAFADNPDTRFEQLAPTVLLPAHTLRLRYLAQLGDGSKEWRDEWQGTAQQSLPRAVHLVFEPRERGSGQQTFELVVPILAWRHDELEPATAGMYPDVAGAPR